MVGSNCYLFNPARDPVASASFGPELVGPAAACTSIETVREEPPPRPSPYVSARKADDFFTAFEDEDGAEKDGGGLGLLGHTSAYLWRTLKSLPKAVGRLMDGGGDEDGHSMG